MVQTIIILLATIIFGGSMVYSYRKRKKRGIVEKIEPIAEPEPEPEPVKRDNNGNISCTCCGHSFQVTFGDIWTFYGRFYVFCPQCNNEMKISL